MLLGELSNQLIAHGHGWNSKHGDIARHFQLSHIFLREMQWSTHNITPCDERGLAACVPGCRGRRAHERQTRLGCTIAIELRSASSYCGCINTVDIIAEGQPSSLICRALS